MAPFRAPEHRDINTKTSAPSSSVNQKGVSDDANDELIDIVATENCFLNGGALKAL